MLLGNLGSGKPVVGFVGVKDKALGAEGDTERPPGEAPKPPPKPLLALGEGPWPDEPPPPPLPPPPLPPPFPELPLDEAKEEAKLPAPHTSSCAI